jgi:very-short-patch-repair endonuclease
MLRTRLATGIWVPLDTAVFAHIAGRPTWERSVAAAILAEPWAVASHRTAAVLHKLEGFRQGRPEITIPPGANARGRLSLSRRGVDVPATRIDDIAVVTLPQAFIDLAQVIGEPKLRQALGEKAAATPTVLDAVRDRYCELAPRGGRDLRPLRAVLERFGAGDLPTESELERVLRLVLTDPRIPPIRWQAPFPGRAAGGRRVDGLIECWSLVIEGDGRAWHTRVDDFESDRRRDAEAAAAGLQTLRFTWHQVKQEPAWVRGTVLAVGAHRGAA